MYGLLFGGDPPSSLLHRVAFAVRLSTRILCAAFSGVTTSAEATLYSRDSSTGTGSRLDERRDENQLCIFCQVAFYIYSYIYRSNSIVRSLYTRREVEVIYVWNEDFVVAAEGKEYRQALCALTTTISWGSLYVEVSTISVWEWGGPFAQNAGWLSPRHSERPELAAAMESPHAPPRAGATCRTTAAATATGGSADDDACCCCCARRRV